MFHHDIFNRQGNDRCRLSFDRKAGISAHAYFPDSNISREIYFEINENQYFVFEGHLVEDQIKFLNIRLQ